MSTNNEFEDLMLELDSQSRIPLSKDPLLVRIYSGGNRGPQVERFLVAAGKAEKELGINIKFEEMTLKLLRESSLSLSGFVDWLLSSHCHFIICHPHQHTLGLGWGVNELYTELQRTIYHNGFPRKLTCAIFTQDKYKYLEAMPAGYKMPTIKIPLSRDMWKHDISSIMATVTSMMNEQPPGTKFILKPGYVTNSNHFKKYVSTKEEVENYLRKVMDDMYGDRPTCYELPYIMLQVRVTDNSEVKMVFMNKQFSHMVSSESRLVKKSFTGFSLSELVAFAIDALNLLPEEDYILDGLVRVDIFLTDDGRLVVNEFESLEASYFTTNLREQGVLESFLDAYWERKFYESLM